jgi:tetratricopeptide (TPR) repeat protein
MHRALIVPSKYDPSTGYLDREGWRHSSRVLGARLEEHGYAVETLEPGPGLVRKLRQALATEDPLSAVVIVFCGYLLLTETNEPALLLSDEQVIALRLEQLCSKAARTFGRVLLVIDGVRGSSTRVVQEANPNATGGSPEELLSEMAAKTVRADNSGLLLSLAPWGAPDAVPDYGLCQRLTDILGELDDTQAMSTPELEFTLNSPYGAEPTVTVRHSKPAFVFLPARRFHSQPPAGSAPSSLPQQRLETHVGQHGKRSQEEDRSSWASPQDTPTPVPTRESSRPSNRTSFNPIHLPAEGVLPPPPLPPIPTVRAPSLGVPPPLPADSGPRSSVADAETSPTSDFAAPEQQPYVRPSVRPLGVPPPLPSERVSVSPPPVDALGMLPAPPPMPQTTAAAQDVDRPRLVPPPLPGELEGAAENSVLVAPLVAREELPAVVMRPNALPSAETTTPNSDDPQTPKGAAVQTPDSAEPQTPNGAPAQTPDASAPPRSGPPARKRRDSSNLEAAPSLPPLAISPESWRPHGLAATAPRDEAALLALANVALAQGQNELALQHATECLDTFPESASALQIVATVLVGNRQFEQLAEIYDRLIAALAPTAAAQLCAAAARLWHSQLNNTDAARQRLERGLQLDANNGSLHRELADLLDESGDSAAALQHSYVAVQLNPSSPQAGNAAFQRLEKTAARERTFNVACVLSFLGQASNRVADVVATHRSPTLPKPGRPLTEEDFALGMDVTHFDPDLTGLLAQLEPYARMLELPKPKLQRQLLDSLRAEDVERSTTMLARTFGWTCRLLTLGTPTLFLAESDALPSRLPVDQVTFVVGKSLGRGLSLSELVFIWARSLGLARMQTRILYTLPSAVKLVHFIHACRCAAGLEAAANGDTKDLVKAVKKVVPTQAWGGLSPQLAALTSSYDTRVEQWKHHADRASNCIGLLACGDPELAARTLDRFPLLDGAPKRQQLADLLTFALSDDYETLRSRLGLHLG